MITRNFHYGGSIPGRDAGRSHEFIEPCVYDVQTRGGRTGRDVLRNKCPESHATRGKSVGCRAAAGACGGFVAKGQESTGDCYDHTGEHTTFEVSCALNHG